MREKTDCPYENPTYDDCHHCIYGLKYHLNTNTGECVERETGITTTHEH